MRCVGCKSKSKGGASGEREREDNELLAMVGGNCIIVVGSWFVFFYEMDIRQANDTSP